MLYFLIRSTFKPKAKDPALYPAKTNLSAFENLLTELGISGLSDIDEPTLSSVLSYHVVVGANQLSTNLSDGMEFSTADGGTLLFNFGDNGEGILTDNNGRTSNIIAVDVQADNGIIHAIDTVVLP